MRYNPPMTRTTNGPPDWPRDRGIQQMSNNANTILPPSFRDVSRELALELARRIAEVADFFSRRFTTERPVAARLALLGTGELQLHELGAAPEAFVCVGRHTEASLRVESSDSLSLRHVLLIPRATADDDIQVDIVPLSPMVRVAPWPHEIPAIAGTVTTAMLLGDSLLLIAPAVLPGRASSLQLEPDPAAGLPHRSSSPNGHVPLRTRITMAPSLSDMPSVDPADEGLFLEVRNKATSVCIALREEWLACGLLIGRSPGKCSYAALAHVLAHPEISRCHLFLRREDDSVVFYDTASTWGVVVNDKDVRRVCIPAPRPRSEAPNGAREAAINPEGLSLQLSADVFITLRASAPGGLDDQTS